MCARAYSGSVRRSECWENPALPGSVSARGIVRPAICFVKPQTTTCSAFLLGQAQDVDFHCTGFWLCTLGFRALSDGPESPPLQFGSWDLEVGRWELPTLELPVTHSMGLAFPACRLGSPDSSVYRRKTIARRLASSLLYEGQRLKVSSPRSESGGDYPPITLPMHPGEATSLPRALYGTWNPEPGT